MLWNQTPQMIKEESQKAPDAEIGLMAPGCGIVSKTPTENLQTMVEMAKRHKH